MVKSEGITDITVSAVMGDQEAFRFAAIIKAFLEREGYEPTGINQAMTREPLQGIEISPNPIGPGVQILVGAA